MNSERLLGESNAFLEVLERVSRLAQIPRSVLLIGERGTGKLFAHRLHTICQPVGSNPSSRSTVPHW